MEYRGLCGWQVSVLTLGTWQFGDPTNTYAKQSEQTEDEIVKTAIDGGINFFDTAEGYANGEAERALGRALARSGAGRSSYYIASKVSDMNIDSEQKIIDAVNRSLKNLDTPYIDLYQIHWPNHNVSHPDVLRTLDRLKKEGKIRAIGISNFGVLDTEEAATKTGGVEIASNQLPYSLVTRAIEYGTIQKCVEHNIGVLAYSPLAQGLLTGKYHKIEDMNEGLLRSRHFHHSRSSRSRHGGEGCEGALFATLESVRDHAKKADVSMADLAIKWVLAQKGVTSALVGASKAEQIASNIKGVSSAVSQDVLEELTKVSEPVKKHLGENFDLWAKETESRVR
eukprot:TRINITY_DN2241_c0_g1_i3.p1 TRINITY_DN2241_c0_g1~~TRINITY_DN2241_c0_g1_i3.p1  ORF type:complete len:339 (+),score=71.45 TRINITY_DN2241_c0_g1_i3:40-1056(+)